MTSFVACMVCARPFDALLTSGLHAGVVVMAVVALGVNAALARGVIGLLREDRAAHVDGSRRLGHSFSSAEPGSSHELPGIDANPSAGRSHARG